MRLPKKVSSEKVNIKNVTFVTFWKIIPNPYRFTLTAVKSLLGDRGIKATVRNGQIWCNFCHLFHLGN